MEYLIGKGSQTDNVWGWAQRGLNAVQRGINHKRPGGGTMRNPTDSKLKVIKIMDPLLCVRCENAYIADVVMRDGRSKKMFYCSRLDCDNWVAKSSSASESTDLDLAA
jgi:hypothetical protein